jgi:NAD(P)-dependent dehydrogenase (short-subunit alcohol dehydrogenase family)
MWVAVSAGAAAAAAAVRIARRRPRRAEPGAVALVTGGSRGLGFLLARDLVDRGYRVAICARDVAELAEAATALRAGGDVLALPCDVADPEQVDRLVTDVVDRFGRLDVLVTNAGVIEVGPLAAMSVDDFATALDVMFWGTLHPTLAALPHLRSGRRGRIIHITSIGGKISPPHLLPYSCAKFAAVGFSEGLRAELAGTGVTVTTAVPGLMRTGSHLRASFKGQRDKEFAWFAVAASTPGLSMDARVAARRIVSAGLAGRPELILTPAAKVAARVHGLLPATTVRALAVTNRLLPRHDGGPTSAVAGTQASAELDSGLLNAATVLGRAAARRLHQHAGSDRRVP